MTISQAANLMSLPIAIVCFSISIRAFYIYNLSRSDMLFVLGMSMVSIAAGTFMGTIGDAHVGGNHWATDWTRSFGACSGGLFIFLSSLVKSNEQLQRLRRWQRIAMVLFGIVIISIIIMRGLSDRQTRRNPQSRIIDVVSESLSPHGLCNEIAIVIHRSIHPSHQ